MNGYVDTAPLTPKTIVYVRGMAHIPDLAVAFQWYMTMPFDASRAPHLMCSCGCGPLRAAIPVVMSLS